MFGPVSWNKASAVTSECSKTRSSKGEKCPLWCHFHCRFFKWKLGRIRASIMREKSTFPKVEILLKTVKKRSFDWRRWRSAEKYNSILQLLDRSGNKAASSCPRFPQEVAEATSSTSAAPGRVRNPQCRSQDINRSAQTRGRRHTQTLHQVAQEPLQRR